MAMGDPAKVEVWMKGSRLKAEYACSVATAAAIIFLCIFSALLQAQDLAVNELGNQLLASFTQNL